MNLMQIIIFNAILQSGPRHWMSHQISDIISGPEKPNFWLKHSNAALCIQYQTALFSQLRTTSNMFVQECVEFSGFLSFYPTHQQVRFQKFPFSFFDIKIKVTQKHHHHDYHQWFARAQRYCSLPQVLAMGCDEVICISSFRAVVLTPFLGDNQFTG